MKNKIMSIQSHLAYGYVGNNVASLAIEMQGLDVVSLPTIILAAHSGHQPNYGEVIPKHLFDELVVGIKSIGLIETVAGIISGYIKTEELIHSVSSLVCDIKKEHPDQFYVCDPVMGDLDIGLYVPKQIAQKIIDTLIPLCDVLTPNHFELEYILGESFDSADVLLELVRNNSLVKDKTVIVTSCNLKDTPAKMIETVVVTPNEVRHIRSPKVDLPTVGTGDIFTAIFASQITKGKSVNAAAEIASMQISKILDYMNKQGYVEMNAECLLNSGLAML